MKPQPKLTIIIPARHEENTIIDTIQSLESVKTPHTILVVHDFSDPTDTTCDIVHQYAKSHTAISLLTTTAGGFAQTLAAGIRITRTPYLVPIMADTCDDPATIDIMYEKIHHGYDVVCGTRYEKGGKKIGGPQIQGFFSTIVNAFLSHYIPTTDASNSFKMYKTSVIKPILAPVRGGVEFSIELIGRAHRNNARITEIPTTWRGRTKGKSKFHIVKRLPKYIQVITKILSNNISVCCKA
jgi:dolichol-phosphate mannosyltransferase